MSHPYACSICGGPAIVSDDGAISRACGHDDATVIAERTSILYGEGGASEPSLYHRAANALQKLARVLS